MIALSSLSTQVNSLCQNVADFIRKEQLGFSLDRVETKGKHDFVSDVDKTSEQLLVKGLKELLPEANFITEEQMVDQGGGEGYCWIVDPLDGTTNFIHGIPFFAISVALTWEKKPILGTVLEVNRTECFSAFKDGGAWLNGSPIAVSKTSKLDNALLATGFPYNDFSKIDHYLSFFKSLMRQTSGLRRIGSAALDLAYVAAGKFDGFYEYGLSPWDVAAGAIIVEEAGGVVTDFKGGDGYIFGKEILASNDLLAPTLQEMADTYF